MAYGKLLASHWTTRGGEMPPKGWRKAPQTEAAALGAGLSLISSFFTKPAVPSDAELPAKKRGRPRKEETRGRKRGADGEAAASVTSSTRQPRFIPDETVVDEPSQARLTRTNWAEGSNAALLKAAVEDWDNKTGE